LAPADLIAGLEIGGPSAGVGNGGVEGFLRGVGPFGSGRLDENHADRP